MSKTPILIRLALFASFAAWLAFGPAALAESKDKPKATAQQLLQDPHVVEAIGLLEAWVEAELAYQRLPGLSMAVVYDQDVIWSKAFGYADLEGKRPATTETIYSICSISKLFTSIGVMQLRDEGKLRLDDSLSDHIPWLEIQHKHSEAGPATVEAILTHSSGLPRESAHSYWSGPDFLFPSRQEIIQGLTSQSTLYPASTFYQYSNLGMTLAGELIIQLSGLSYQDYARQKILAPLGLHSTTPEIPVQEQGKRLAVGYGVLDRQGKRQKMPIFQARGIAPAAGYASTVEDLARFASWQFRLLEKGGQEVLKANTLREMQRVHWVDPDWSAHRGLGFGVWRDEGKIWSKRFNPVDSGRVGCSNSPTRPRHISPKLGGLKHGCRHCSGLSPRNPPTDRPEHGRMDRD
ncbi:MAG: serine hydrolase domain-containing protein [Acidobacteriota bacterium]